jgi:hypothetical protein
MRSLALILALAASQASGHDYNLAKVARLEVDGRFSKIHLMDTHAGRNVACVVYDSEGNFLTSKLWPMSDLVTAVFVNLEGMRPASVRCAVQP